MAFCEFRRHRDFFGRTDDRDPKKLVPVIQSDQRDITREARLDEEANELPELAVVSGISLANDVAHDGIIGERRAKDVHGGDLVTAIKIAQSHREFLRVS
jgi:hypothetical protein